VDYYNDFQKMVRSDDISKVIDRYRVRNGKDCADNKHNQSISELADVLSAMRAVGRKAYPALSTLCKICASLTVHQLALFLHITAGGPLISFAMAEGITEQAAHQMWMRIVRKNPSLANIRKRRRKHEYDNRTSSGSRPHPTHDVLGKREGESGGLC
jgi:hypothetical protein